MGTLIRLVSDLVWLYPAIAVGFLINYLTDFREFDPWYVFGILGIWLVCSCFHYIGRDIAKYLVYQVAESSALDAVFQTLRHLIHLDLDWQEGENSGNKLKRIMHGYEGFNRLIRLFVDLVCESSVNAVFVIVILAIFDPFIALGMSFYMLSFYLIAFKLLDKAKRQSRIVNVMEEEVQGQFFEIINNVATVKWLGLEKPLLKSFRILLSDLMNEMRRRIQYFRTRAGILGMYNEVFRLSLLIYIVFGVYRGDYKVGILAIFFNYFTKVQLAADELSQVTSEFIIQKIRIKRMMGILQQIPHVELSGTEYFSKNWRKLEVRNLGFAYQKRKYLDGLNLTIRRGEKIGVVGLSGAGKTTLFKLLLGLYEDYEGDILFDGVSLHDIKRGSYLKQTAVVLQETEVFNLSLADNIMVSGSRRDKKRLEQAIKIAHIDEFLHKLPKRERSLIGEKGVKLSGGEKQRIGIARAIYKNPQILFMDEATSHLDVDSEQMIQDSLHQFFQGVTAIVIAHRLSTIKEMDRIVVMASGRIVEQGRFRYLMKKSGEFYRLWQKQLKRR